MNISFKNKKQILILGDIMLDKYLWGKVERISPEAPVPVVNISNETYNLGGAGNVANNIRELGGKIKIYSSIGKDSNAKIVIEMLEKQDISFHLMKRNYPTISKIRVLGAGQQMLRIDYEENIDTSRDEIDEIVELLKIDIANSDIIILSDYKKGFLSEDLIKIVLFECQKKKKKVIVDPKGNNWDKYNKAYILTPNLKEFSDIVKLNILNEDSVIEHYGRIIREKYELEYLLVTRSEKGMTLISKNDVLHISTLAQEVFDVSGAGDTVVAVLALSLVSNYNINDAVKLANFAAGIVVGKVGTVPITLAEMKIKLT